MKAELDVKGLAVAEGIGVGVDVDAGVAVGNADLAVGAGFALGFEVAPETLTRSSSSKRFSSA
jgi:hypothetical protein